MNVDLLKKVRDEILKHAEYFDMDVWGRVNGICVSSGTINIRNCGTTACFAGFIWLVHKKAYIAGSSYKLKKAWEGFSVDEARKLVGFSTFNPFYLQYWPLTFYVRYVKATTPLQRAKVLAKYINYLIIKENPRLQTKLERSLE